MELHAQRDDDGITTLRLTGRMDVPGTSAVETSLMAHCAHAGPVLLDLSAVDFLASFGIRALFVAAKASRLRGGRLVVLSAPGPVSQVLQMAGVDKAVPCFDDAARARAALA